VWTAVAYGGIGIVCGPVLVDWAQRASNSPLLFIPRWPKQRAQVVCVTMAAVLVLLSVGYRWGGSSASLAFGWLAITGVLLTSIDMDCHRLPHREVAAMAYGGLLLLAIAGPARLPEAAAAALVVFSAMFLLGLLSGAQIGFGDVTLSAAVSLYLGWLGWRHVVLGMTVAVVLAGIVGLALLASRRARPGDRFAFGPLIIGGAYFAVLVP
jgi:leader peptidase (prepilin peptidase) / N-methyltransferase